MILKLQIEVVRPKNFCQLLRLFQGLVIIPGQQLTGNLACQAGAQGDQTLAVLPQQRQVDPGLAVKALNKAHGDEIAEIPVACLVFTQQHQMPGLVVDPVDPVLHRPGCDIDLAA